MPTLHLKTNEMVMTKILTFLDSLSSARDQLRDVKAYISNDNRVAASKHVKRVIERIKKILEYPFIGKSNVVYNQEDIREIAVEGYKVIYQSRPVY